MSAMAESGGVRLVARLGTGTLAASREALAAVPSGVATVLLALAGDAPCAARLPFELADFEPGPAPAPAPLPRADVDALVTAARASGIDVVLSVADADAVGLARAAGAPALHLPAAAILDLTLVATAAEAGVPLWIDTAMTALDEVAETVAAAVKRGARVTLLHGLATAGRPEELNLRALVSLRERFGVAVGWQARDAVPAAVTAAVALGATVVVVPFDAAGRTGFDAAALATLHADVGFVTRALGDGDKRVQASEWTERDRAQRSLVARVDIARGATLTADMLGTARPGIGLKPRAATGVVGRRAIVDIPAGTLLTLGMVE